VAKAPLAPEQENELLCRFLEQEHEAISIVLAGLFERERDVLLVLDPTYTGVTRMASLLGVRRGSTSPRSFWDGNTFLFKESDHVPCI
jgi:hypothetical protein